MLPGYVQKPSLVLHRRSGDAGRVTTKHSALAVLVAIVWGVNFVVIDKGLAGVPPLLLVAIRFALVAVPLVFVVPRPTSGWRTVVAVGAFMSLGQFSLLYVGLHLGMPAGLASLVLQAQVVFTMVIARLALGERSTRRRSSARCSGRPGWSWSRWLTALALRSSR